MNAYRMTARTGARPVGLWVAVALVVMATAACSTSSTDDDDSHNKGSRRGRGGAVAGRESGAPSFGLGDAAP